VLSIAVTEGNNLRMFRCVELESGTPEEVAAVLFPTYAFVEDEWKRRPERLLLCGFGTTGDDTAHVLEAELSTRVEPMRGTHGTPGPYNAGLMGYLQAMGMEVAA
jgi:hypothetical protein